MDEPREADAKISAVKGTTSENIVKGLLPQTKHIYVENIAKDISIVVKGEVNAFLTDSPICLSVLKRYPDSGFQSVVSFLTYEPIGMALPASDPLLMNLARNFIDRAENIDLMRRLAVKWFKSQANSTLLMQIFIPQTRKGGCSRIKEAHL